MDFVEILRVLGNGLIKLLIGLSIGVGVGLLIIGILAVNEPDAWTFRDPPPIGPLFLGIGAGFLAFTIMLVLLFYGPWARKGTPGTSGPERPRKEV